MKLIILTSILFITGCATDPIVIRYQNWENVTKTLSKNKVPIKTCKKNYESQFRDSFVIYTFNIIDNAAVDIITFNDPYKLPNDFHQCVGENLSKIKFNLNFEEEFRNGYLLINREEERFNYVLY